MIIFFSFFQILFSGLPKHLQFLSDQSQALKELNSELDTNPSTAQYTSHVSVLNQGTGSNQDDYTRSTWDLDTGSSKVMDTRVGEVGGRGTRDTSQRFRNHVYTPYSTNSRGAHTRSTLPFNQRGIGGHSHRVGFRGESLIEGIKTGKNLRKVYLLLAILSYITWTYYASYV